MENNNLEARIIENEDRVTYLMRRLEALERYLFDLDNATGSLDIDPNEPLPPELERFEEWIGDLLGDK